MQVRPRLGKHWSAATPPREHDFHARSENTDHDSSKMDQRSWLSGHRRSWTTCRSVGKLALLVDLRALLPATDYGLVDLQGAATEPRDKATGGGPPQREWWTREESPRTNRDHARAENFWQLGPYFDKWQVRFAKLLKMSCFSPSHLLFRVGKLQQIIKENVKLLEMLKIVAMICCFGTYKLTDP